MRRAEDTVQPETPSEPLQQTYSDVHLQAYEALGFNVTTGQGDEADSGRGVFINSVAADPVNGGKVNSFGAYVAPLWPEGPCADNLRIVHGATVSRVIVEDGVSTGALSTSLHARPDVQKGVIVSHVIVEDRAATGALPTSLHARPNVRKGATVSRVIVQDGVATSALPTSMHERPPV